MQHTAVPEKVRPGALRRHHARVALLPLGGNLIGGQGRAVMLRQGVLLEPRAVRGRIELERLLENDGLAAPAGAAATGRRPAVARGREAEGEVLGGRQAESPPEGTLEGEKEARYHGPRCHGDFRAADVGRSTSEAYLQSRR